MCQEFDIALSFATEEQELVEKVYYYLRAEGLSVFYAPSSEAQKILSGRNQREVFYEIFALRAKYVALFVSKNYIAKAVPMEEAEISFVKHGDNETVIPIYLDEASLPENLLDAKKTNYLRSSNPAAITDHLAVKIKSSAIMNAKKGKKQQKAENVMNLSGNIAGIQNFIQCGRTDNT